MKKIFKILPLTMTLTVLIAGASFAQEVRENKSFREEYKKIETISARGRTKTITRNYSQGRDIPDAVPYREYVDNCWWSGSLQRINTEYDHSNKWWHVTFSGTLTKSECFSTIALDKNGKAFGEIISTGSFMPLPGDNTLETMEDTQGYSPKRREVRVRVYNENNIPPTYYYEEYDEARGCVYGGNLSLSRTYKDNGNIIAVYNGYINAAC